MKSIMFLCGGYRASYNGNFIPSLLTIEEKIKEQFRCVYVFHHEVKKYQWFKELNSNGHIVETMDFDAGLLARIKEIKRISQKWQVSIIHVHFGDKLAATIYGHLTGTNIIWHIHTDGSCGKKGIQNIRDCLIELKAFFGKRVIGRRVTRIAVSGDLAKKENAIHIPNGLALNRINKYDAAFRARKRLELGIPPETIMILLFGWSLDIKGLDLAYWAVKQLHEENKNICLYVVCAKDLLTPKEYLKNKCGYSENDSFIVFLPSIEDVYAYHSIADIFLSASRSEGFSYSLLEALSIGKPCVISNIKGTAWAKEFYDVEFFQSGDISALVKAIERMTLRISQSDVRPEADIRLVKEKYSAETMAEQVAKVYHMIDGRAK